MPALFETDLMRALDDNSFNYTATITNFSQSILNIFVKLLDDLEKIPEVEQKIMLQVFKKEKSQKYLTVPSLKNPPEGELNQNLWIQELHANLK